MKFSANVQYDIGAEDLRHAQEIIDVLTSPRTFTNGFATVIGINLNKAYVPLATDEPVPA